MNDCCDCLCVCAPSSSSQSLPINKSLKSEGFIWHYEHYLLSFSSITHTPSCFPPVKAIIEHEAKNGIPPNRIMLGGFSQVRLWAFHICSTIHSEILVNVYNELLLVSLLPSSGRGLVLVYCIDLPASVGWCCGPQLLAATSQELPFGTVKLPLQTSLLGPVFKRVIWSIRWTLLMCRIIVACCRYLNAFSHHVDFYVSVSFVNRTDWGLINYKLRFNQANLTPDRSSNRCVVWTCYCQINYKTTLSLHSRFRWFRKRAEILVDNKISCWHFRIHLLQRLSQQNPPFI